MIVEDGTIVEGANSYCDLAFADEYFATFGNSSWSASDEDKELALIQACQSLDALYGPRYASFVKQTSQPLLFPRYDFTGRSGRTYYGSSIPTCLKQAQCELALLALQGEDLFPAEEDEYADQEVQVDVIKVRTGGKRLSDGPSYAGFDKIDYLLADILISKKGSRSMVL